MEQKLYTITVYSENHVGLLTLISNIFTRRFINIESLTVSASKMKGVHKFTITCVTDSHSIEKLIKQIEKKIDVLKAYYYTDDEIISREIALFKVSTDVLLNNNMIEGLVSKYNVKVLEVNNLYTVIEKTGGQSEIQQLFEELESLGILQFVRSGCVSITRSKYERFSDFLASREEEL
ncbi:MAG: acetolactate synthase small subunit [Prevotellaceae bacterium]|jgi:acetolactate synthase-1/3 small subunit|nr:acetolactate synthase small subunit [Prevotellaceae bacterium]